MKDGSLYMGDVEVDFFLFEGSSQADCFYFCSISPGCTGVEHNPTSQRCEVWMSAIVGAASVPGYNCYTRLLTVYISATVSGQACRTKKDGALYVGDVGSAFLIQPGVLTYEDCLQKCAGSAGCTGVEHNPVIGRCEVWLTPILGTEVVDGFNCYSITTIPDASSPPPSPSPPSPSPPPTLIFSATSPGQACRTKKDGTLYVGDEGSAFQLQPGVLTYEDCHQKCAESTGCTGVEHNPASGRCEVWLTPILGTEVVAGFNCYSIASIKNGALYVGDEGSAFQLQPGVSTYEDCRQKCAESTGCTGVEHNPASGRCEVWLTPILGTEVVAGFNCYSTASIVISGPWRCESCVSFPTVISIDCSTGAVNVSAILSIPLLPSLSQQAASEPAVASHVEQIVGAVNVSAILSIPLVPSLSQQAAYELAVASYVEQTVGAVTPTALLLFESDMLSYNVDDVYNQYSIATYGTLPEAQAACILDLNCFGFNTNGILKNNPQQYGTDNSYTGACQGFYIKTDCASFAGFTFIQGVNSVGNNMVINSQTAPGFYSTASANRMTDGLAHTAGACNQVGCLGFNINGYVKSSVSNKKANPSWSGVEYTCLGLYERNGIPALTCVNGQLDPIPGFIFYQGYDAPSSPPNSINIAPRKNSIAAAAAACLDLQDECVGFNTEGDLKRSTQSYRAEPRYSGSCHGFFMRKECPSFPGYVFTQGSNAEFFDMEIEAPWPEFQNRITHGVKNTNGYLKHDAKTNFKSGAFPSNYHCSGFYTRVSLPPIYEAGGTYLMSSLEVNPVYSTLCSAGSSDAIKQWVSESLHADCDSTKNSYQPRSCLGGSYTKPFSVRAAGTGCDKTNRQTIDECDDFATNTNGNDGMRTCSGCTSSSCSLSVVNVKGFPSKAMADDVINKLSSAFSKIGNQPEQISALQYTSPPFADCEELGRSVCVWNPLANPVSDWISVPSMMRYSVYEYEWPSVGGGSFDSPDAEADLKISFSCSTVQEKSFLSDLCENEIFQGAMIVGGVASGFAPQIGFVLGALSLTCLTA
eukprot:gene9158-16284_t